ncbi:MAG: YfiT family bacillithiol transferase [Bacteroidota bacterium]
MNLEQLKYPIGHYKAPETITTTQLLHWTNEIRELPKILTRTVNGLTEDELNTPYRPGGWTIRQVVHHLPDSHMNAYVRFKLALTESNPSIRPYYEDRWAELEASKTAAIEPSLFLLNALHRKWIVLIQSCSEAELKKTFFHPESKASSSLAFNIGNYAWHGKHHLAQIKNGLRL